MKKTVIILAVVGVLLTISFIVFLISVKEILLPGRMMRRDLPGKGPSQDVIIGGPLEEAHPPALPDLSEIVEDELKKLSPGCILFNPSQEMKVGVKERVEVRIAKTITEDLTLGLRGRGIPQIEKIGVATFMKVHLTGDNFDIKTLSHDEQPVIGEGFTQWDWDVIPLKFGIQSLLLTVTVRIKIPNYDEEKKDYPVFEKQIRVKVNLTYSINKFIKNYWQWIIGTIIASGIIKWIVTKLRRLQKKK